MRLLLDNILKYRTQILLFLVLSQFIFLLTSHLDEIPETPLDEASGIITVLIVLFSLAFLYKLNIYQSLAKKREYIQNLSPSRYIYYDSISRELSIPNATRAALYLEQKKSYRLSDISTIFPLSEWEEIAKYLESPRSYLGIDKFGSVEINITKADKIYFKYTIQSVKDKQFGLYGVIFWFSDFTNSRLAELELLQILRRYREMGFDLSSTFDELPIPMWKRDVGGELILHNNAFEKVKKYADDNLVNLIKKADSSGFIKNIIIKNTTHTYKFQEVNTDNSDEKIGYAIDISEGNAARKNITYLKNTIDTILELSSNATLIIDDKRRVIKYNTAFVNLFDLDRTWLSDSVTYFSLLDKLKEQGKLAETRDYKEFKDSQVKFLNELKAPHHALQHLPGGRTLRVSTVPTEIGNTIFVYDNVTDVLAIERSYNELMVTFKTLLSELNSAVCVLDNIGKVRVYNTAFGKFINGNDEDLPADSVFYDLLHSSKNGILIDNKESILHQLAVTVELRKSICITIEHKNSYIKVSLDPLPDNGALIVFHL